MRSVGKTDIRKMQALTFRILPTFKMSTDGAAPPRENFMPSAHSLVDFARYYVKLRGAGPHREQLNSTHY